MPDHDPIRSSGRADVCQKVAGDRLPERHELIARRRRGPHWQTHRNGQQRRERQQPHLLSRNLRPRSHGSETALLFRTCVPFRSRGTAGHWHYERIVDASHDLFVEHNSGQPGTGTSFSPSTSSNAASRDCRWRRRPPRPCSASRTRPATRPARWKGCCGSWTCCRRPRGIGFWRIDSSSRAGRRSTSSTSVSTGSRSISTSTMSARSTGRRWKPNAPTSTPRSTVSSRPRDSGRQPSTLASLPRVGVPQEERREPAGFHRCSR